MQVNPAAIHAFSLLVEPDRVCQAVARSERLARLRSRVFRPLDRPLIPTRVAAISDWDEVDIDLDDLESEFEPDPT
ncbi:hypothetical protein [Inhella gelatinilytica]|uniref:Uncharacterized protein n=1 Tax=Inhella gelatinilytica TaxID=2795030 RepID=A0A931IXX8_9BURK|nr:hypothetical protein [Inhella gelatinilytica]MBH9553050.1 hypothetical protein [Inhella gelatinilytica]